MSDEKPKTKPEDLKLIGREQVTSILAPTEGLAFTDLKPGNNMEVRFHGTKDGPLVNLGGTELRINPQALQDSAHCCGFTTKYTNKCPSDLLFDALNYWYGEGLTAPVRAISREGVLIGMTKDRVKTQVISNERLLRLAEQKIGSDHIVGYHQVQSDLNHSSMSVVTDKSFEPVKEDTLFGGIKITNSIMGQDVVEVSPYVFRQWCSNGAITAQALGKYTRKKNDNLDNWLNEIIEGSNNELDKEFERIRHLTGISVKGHVTETVQGIGKDQRISGKIVQEILDEATSSKAETMYDIWNCITKIASHSKSLSPISASKLQYVAGCVTKEHEICNQCHRILN